jgi:hypothetical protein
MPLPFWILGGSQILWGRNLLAARLTGLGLGLGALALVALIARQMAGDLRAGSLDPQGGRSCALWQRLLGRSASESGFYVFYAPLSWPASRSASRSRPLDSDRPGPIANGGPMKRSIGSHVMADQIKTMFEAARKKAAP